MNHQDHTMFVYTKKYQNAILAPLAFELSYKSLMKLVVCDIENRICMIHRCEFCPGKEALSEYLKNEFPHFESDDKIIFHQ